MKFPRRDLTDGYMAGLTRSVEQRLKRGDDLHTAMAETLRERAPVAFRPPPGERTAALGWLLGFGLLTAAGVGLYFAMDRLQGLNPAEMIQHKFGGDFNDGYQPGESYSAVQGTPGAEMPDLPAGTAQQPAVKLDVPQTALAFPAATPSTETSGG